MKKIKSLLIMILIFSLCSFFVCSAKDNKPVGFDQSLINVCDYGASPNDDVDDTAAFTMAINACNGIYVPAGVYKITSPILLKYGILKGDGKDKTVIVADLASTKDPIVWAGGATQIRDITLEYDSSCMTGTEIAGERVGIITTAAGKRHLCRGAAISNVRLKNVGTGIYSPLNGMIKDETESSVAFSVTFENISVIDFSYRGFDMQAELRTGNVYRNIYLSTGKYKANAGFYMNTEESECSVSELTIVDSKLKTPVRFNACYATEITNINFINTELTQDNTGFVYFENSVANIGGLNFKNSAPKGLRQSFIRVGDNMYRQASFNNSGYLYIDNLNIDNPKLDVSAEPTQKFVARKNAFVNDFTVQINNYSINATPQLKAQYECFHKDDKKIILIINNNII